MAEKTELEVKTKEWVALQLADRLIKTDYHDPSYKDDYLDLYVECLRATRGIRPDK